MTTVHSYFTGAEKERLSLEFMTDNRTLGWAGVSMSHLSLARHAGGATVGGLIYRYFPATDELWRSDVVALVHSWRKAALADVAPQVQDQLF